MEIIECEKGVIIWLHRKGGGLKRHSPFCLECRAKCWSIIEYLFLQLTSPASFLTSLIATYCGDSKGGKFGAMYLTTCSLHSLEPGIRTQQKYFLYFIVLTIFLLYFHNLTIRSVVIKFFDVSFKILLHFQEDPNLKDLDRNPYFEPHLLPNLLSLYRMYCKYALFILTAKNALESSRARYIPGSSWPPTRTKEI